MPDYQGTWRQRVVYIVAWLVSTVLLCVGLVLLRNLFMALVTWGLGLLPLEYSWETGATLGWWQEFLNQLSWLFVACLAAILSVAIEYYYRKGIAQSEETPHLLWQRIGRVMGIEVIVVAVGFGLSALIG